MQSGSEAAIFRSRRSREAGRRRERDRGREAGFARGAGTQGWGYGSEEEEVDEEWDARDDALADQEFEALAKAWRALEGAGAVPLGGVPGERDLEAMFPGIIQGSRLLHVGALAKEKRLDFMLWTMPP